MIKITDAALKKLKEIMEPGNNLRVQIVGGGCSGYHYKMSQENYKLCVGDDKQFFFGQFSDVPVCVVIDPRSALFLEGVELDYSDGLEGRGFEFKNPNAKKTCGCGESFSV